MMTGTGVAGCAGVGVAGCAGIGVTVAAAWLAGVMAVSVALTAVCI